MTSKTDRSTSTTGRHILADAFAAVDKSGADKVRQERNWRFGYAKHFIHSVEVGCRNPETALEMAQAGLKSAHTRFEFIRGEEELSFQEAMDKYQENTYHTGILEGSGWGKARKAGEYEVPFKPYASAGEHVPLRGEALKAQLDKWVEYGTIEPEARDAIWMVASSDGWLDLSDKYFVLLGATSAMGPLLVLASLGANIIGVDLDRSGIWEKLTGIIRDSPARLIFPLKKPQAECTDHADLCANAGANLLSDTPEIRNWLREVVPGEQLIIGNYAYLDGELHVRLSVAMDAICGGVCEARADTMLAYLCSPTDVFVMPDACRQAMQRNCRSSPLWQKAVSSLTRFLVPNARKTTIAADGKKFSIVDGLVVAQGPNYALAKRLQHWRAMLARSNGHSVSTNIAPSTATQSVVHNSQFAAAYGGMHHFKPMAIMYQETSNAVMGALLLHDVWNDDGVARPDTPLDNPLQLFGSGAFHGGIWRCGYKIGSIGEMSALIYYLYHYRLPLLATLAAMGGSGFYVANNGAPHHWF